MSMPRFLFAFVMVTAVGLNAQPQAQFEVVSIRPYVSQGNPANERSALDFPSGGRFSATNVNVKKLIRAAFGVENERILGSPGWADVLSYNIEAKTVGGVEVTRDNISGLLQELLASRFGLQYHREKRETSVYDLEVVKNGFKLQPDTSEGKPSMSENSNGTLIMLDAKKLSMAGLAGNLARQLGRPVVDKTGVTEDFDINLKWSPDQAAENAGPSIFAALQEIGLRLVSTKGTVDAIVVDRVEKPSAN